MFGSFMEWIDKLTIYLCDQLTQMLIDINIYNYCYTITFLSHSYYILIIFPKLSYSSATYSAILTKKLKIIKLW